jgi:hypothetical protein
MIDYAGKARRKAAPHFISTQEDKELHPPTSPVASHKPIILWKCRAAIAARPALKKTLQGALDGLQ